MNLSRNGGADRKTPASDSLPRHIRIRTVALVLVLELAAALAAELVATVAEELVDRARAKVPAREFVDEILDDATDDPGADHGQIPEDAPRVVIVDELAELAPE